MLPKPPSAQAKIDRTKKSAPASPAGTTRTMCESGTNAPSSTVSSLRVARMPMTSQVSLIVTPGVLRARKPCTTFGLAGSLVSSPWRPRRVHTGVRLPNDFRPVNL